MNSKTQALVSLTMCALGGLGSSVAAMAQELGTWTRLADLNIARRSPAVVNADGQVYVLGGDCGDCGVFPPELNSVELYDEASDTWTVMSPMPERISSPGVAVLDGLVYVFGGVQVGSGDDRDVYAYDPSVDAWAHVGIMPHRIWELSAVAYGDWIYVVGGRSWEPLNEPRTLAFNPSTGEWRERAPFLGDAVGSHNSLLAIGPSLYLFCALDGDPADVSNYRLSQRYDVMADTWRRLEPMPTPRIRVGTAALAGRCFVIGGTGSSSANEIYDPVGGSWAAAPPLPLSREWVGIVSTKTEVLVVGGAHISSIASSRVDAFRPRSRAGVVPFCFCDEGPCGNSSWNGGCINHSGGAGLLTATGSVSVIMDDLVLAGSRIPSDRLGLVALGGAGQPLAFGNGLICVTANKGALARIPLGSSGSAGELRFGPGILQISSTYGISGMIPGSTWSLQFVFRDPDFGSCGSGWNATNAVAVTLSL